jgi:hypothetical protein
MSGWMRCRFGVILCICLRTAAGSMASEAWRCDYCGEPATPERPLLDCVCAGDSLRLHQDCVEAFLASPGRRPSS